MIRKLVQLMRKEFLQLMRTPALMLILALCLVGIIGVVPLGLKGTPRVRVDVVDLSFSDRGRMAVERLSRSENIAYAVLSPSLRESEKRMDRGEIQSIVVLPADSGQPLILSDGSHAVLGTEAFWQVAQQWAGPSDELAQGRVREHVKFAGGEGSTRYYLIPMLMLLIAISACSITAISVVAELESNRLEHLRSIGVSAPLYVAAKSLYGSLIALVELAVGLLIARFAFDFQPAGPLSAYLLLTICFLTAATGLSILISALCRNQVRTIYVLVFVFIVLALLSTMFAPLDNMQPAWAATRFVNPFFWMVDGSWKVLLKGAGTAAILSNCAALLGIGGILMGLATRKIRRID